VKKEVKESKGKENKQPEKKEEEGGEKSGLLLNLTPVSLATVVSGSVLRSQSIFVRCRLQLVKNSGSGSEYFSNIIKKNSTILMVSKKFHVL
jgi:hypothetical protein